jgi:hypothetical protein
MTWLLRLYPPAWRRRYGDEVAEMLAGRPFSPGSAIDLVAGAIDVWLHPSATLAAAAAAQPEAEEKTMPNRIARLNCAAMLGPDVTKADHQKAAAVTIGGTFVLTLAWMAVRARVGDNDYSDALSVLPFIVSMLFSMRYTYLKHRPASVQAAFVGGFTLVVAAILLASGWVAGRL